MKKFILSAVLAMTAFAAVAGQDANVRIHNNSPVSVVRIQTSPASSKVYGTDDVLGSDVIRPGYATIVNFDTPDGDNSCLQDVKATGSDGRVWKWRMNVCTTVNWYLGN